MTMKTRGEEPAAPLDASLLDASLLGASSLGASSLDARGRREQLELLGILDTAPEDGFDDLVKLAAAICATPVALVGLVDLERQWFKARVGIVARETPLVESVCAQTLSEPGLLVIPDLTLDPRTRDNPAVVGAPFCRFYARARLETANGIPLGTLCVLDYAPRPDGLSQEQLAALAALGRQVQARMELRRALAEHDAAKAALRACEARLRACFEIGYVTQAFLAPDGTLRDANARALKIAGVTLADVVGRKFWELPWYATTRGVPEHLRAMARRAACGETTRREIELELSTGGRVYDVTMRPVVDDCGAILGLAAEGIDLTERRRTETLLHQAQKMEAIGEMTGGAANEFNTLLATIVGYLGFARRRLREPHVAAILKCLEGAEETAGRAMGLTRRLRAVAEAEGVGERPVSAEAG